MQRKTMMLLGALALLIAVLAVFGLREPQRTVMLGNVVRGPFVQSFTEEGKTRLRQRYLVAAPLAGTIGRIDRQPGEAVRAGETLAILTPAVAGLLDPGTRSRLRAEAAAAAASERAARQRVLAAQSAQVLAPKELVRSMELRERGLVSAAQEDLAVAAARQADADLNAATAESQAARQRETAAGALLAGEGQGGGTSLPLTAPIDGVIIRRYQESASPVAAGQPILEIGDPSALEIEVEALSTDAVLLQPGMRARILRWGGPETIGATVARIEPGGFTKISALGVEEQRTRVIVDFDAPRAQWQALGDGFRVEVEFIVFAGEGILQVPSAALFRRDGGWFAYLAEDLRARGVPVEIGARSGASTAIVSGLAEGQLVVLDPDDQIRDGTRLAPIRD
jgi:HlyD family secretion protein